MGPRRAAPRGRPLPGALQRGHARLRRLRLAAPGLRLPLRQRRRPGPHLAGLHKSIERLVRFSYRNTGLPAYRDTGYRDTVKSFSSYSDNFLSPNWTFLFTYLAYIRKFGFLKIHYFPHPCSCMRYKTLSSFGLDFQVPSRPSQLRLRHDQHGPLRGRPRRHSPGHLRARRVRMAVRDLGVGYVFFYETEKPGKTEFSGPKSLFSI